MSRKVYGGFWNGALFAVCVERAITNALSGNAWIAMFNAVAACLIGGVTFVVYLDEKATR